MSDVIKLSDHWDDPQGPDTVEKCSWAYVTKDDFLAWAEVNDIPRRVAYRCLAAGCAFETLRFERVDDLRLGMLQPASRIERGALIAEIAKDIDESWFMTHLQVWLEGIEVFFTSKHSERIRKTRIIPPDNPPPLRLVRG